MDTSFPIPDLRQDLKIYKGGHERDGSPTWMIYDPISDNYFKLGWFEFECLSRLKNYKDMGALAAAVAKDTALEPEKQDVLEFVTFLITNNLCQSSDPVVQNFQLNRGFEKKGLSWSKIFTKYVYFQIPLFKPDQFLKALYPVVSVFLTKRFFYLMMGILLFGLFLTVQRIDSFVASFTQFTNIESIILIIFATIFVKIIHELGHAFVAHKYNVPVTTIGVAFIILYPILYTETTNSWRLYNRNKRLLITGAGVISELYLAAIALVLWHILPAGLAQNTAFFVAVVSLFMSVLINGNPLMKFDGYYLASDLSQIDNLQFRALDFLKWKIRDLLFSADEEPPEYFDEKTERILILFGAALAVYRFFLYLGIALVMYHFLMKPLGFIFMVLEIYIFIAIPILKELRAWYTDRDMLLSQKRPKFIAVFLMICVIVAFFPVSKTIKVPAVIHAQEYTQIYPVAVSQIKEILVQNGALVKKGDALFALVSPLLEKEIKTAQSEISLYEIMKEREGFSSHEQGYDVIFEERILEAQTKLNGLLQQKKALVITAQHDGYIQDIDVNIHVGRWVQVETLLGRVINNGGLSITGYISERDVSRVSEGAKGYFRPDSAMFGQVPVQLAESLSHNTRFIRYPEVSSVHGGIIPAEYGKNGQILSKETLYTAQFSVQKHTDVLQLHSEKGVLFLKASPQIPIIDFSERVLSLFLREVDF